MMGSKPRKKWKMTGILEKFSHDNSYGKVAAKWNTVRTSAITVQLLDFVYIFVFLQHSVRPNLWNFVLKILCVALC